MRIHIIRHAEPDYSIDSLTSKGHREAEALGKYLAKKGVAGLFTSPLGRARATAGYLEKSLGMTATVEDWTAELGGLHMSGRDLHAWDLPGHIIRPALETNPGAQGKDLADYADIPLEATLERIATGSDAFLARLGYRREGPIYRVEKRNEDTFALVCHGGFGLAWLAHLLAIPVSLIWSGFFFHPSSITTVLWDERQRGLATPRCLWVGALPHLAVDGQAPSRAGIIANYH